MRFAALLVLLLSALAATPIGGQSVRTEDVETAPVGTHAQAAPPEPPRRNSEVERLRSRLMDAQLEIREATLRREVELRRVLLIALLIGGSMVLLLAMLYRRKLLANRGLQELNHRLGHKQEALRKANEQLERLNREMNDVLAVVSHDLKNPLAGVEGLARELRSESNGIDVVQQRAMLEMIEDSARRMFSLVSDLLDLQRIEAGHHGLRAQPVELVGLARASVRDFALPARRKGQRIKFTGPETMWVTGDESALMRVINNLLSNALKYSPQGTQVHVELVSAAGQAKLCVSDEGPGIPQMEMGRLFQKFSRLSTRPTGGEPSTGLGLAIVRGIVEALGGRIWVESVVGQGATFCISLPTAEPPGHEVQTREPVRMGDTNRSQ